MRHLTCILLVLLITSCGTTYKLSTHNHDPIYDSHGDEIQVDYINNDFELDRKFRTDFIFRYNYAQYALTQPRSFDWNNRILRNRYNFYNPYGFNMWSSSYSNRDMMWNDWVWGYPYFTPHRWSPFGYDRWGYNNYGWNNWSSNVWGWNGYYGNGWIWRHQMNYYNWSNNRRNTVRVSGRRGSVSNEKNKYRKPINNRTFRNRRNSIKTDNVKPIIKHIEQNPDVKVRRYDNIDNVPRIRNNRNEVIRNNSDRNMRTPTPRITPPRNISRPQLRQIQNPPSRTSGNTITIKSPNRRN